jgi:hypothetical protein
MMSCTMDSDRSFRRQKPSHDLGARGCGLSHWGALPFDVGTNLPSPHTNRSYLLNLTTCCRASVAYGFFAATPGGLKLSIPLTVIPPRVPVRGELNSRKPGLTQGDSVPEAVKSTPVFLHENTSSIPEISSAPLPLLHKGRVWSACPREPCVRVHHSHCQHANRRRC